MDKGMNVRFIGETIPLELTNNKIYSVISTEKGWYRIIDDTGEDYLYPPECLKSYRNTRMYLFNVYNMQTFL